MKLKNAAALLMLSATPLLAQQTTPVDDAQARLACGACAGVAMAVPIVALIISIIIAIWIFKDAQRRNDPQAPMWALLGALFNVVGLVIYLVVRKQRQQQTPPPSVPPPPPPPPPAMV